MNEKPTHYEQAKILLEKYPPNSKVYIKSWDEVGIVRGYKIDSYSNKIGLIIKVYGNTWFVEDSDDIKEVI